MDTRKIRLLQEEFVQLGRQRNSLFSPLQRLPWQIAELLKAAENSTNALQKQQFLAQVADLQQQLARCQAPENLRTIEALDNKLQKIGNAIQKIQVETYGFSKPSSPSFLNK